jgi:hypothetical protein
MISAFKSGLFSHDDGRGDQWEADNYIRLNGEAVKNKELVQNFTTK